MATRRIQEYLSGNKTPYARVNHRLAFTAQEVAQTSHIPGHSMAKSVIVHLDGRLAIVVLPATRLVDLARLRCATGAQEVRLAEESEFSERFADCQVGTVPPFGNLFGVETYVDREMAQDRNIAFNGGTHTDVFVIRYADYVKLAQPQLVDVAMEEARTASSKAAGAAIKRARIRAAAEEFALESEALLQPQCGCAIEFHEGAD